MGAASGLLERISPQNRRRAVIAAGVIGLLLIFISSLLPEKSSEETTTDEPPPVQTESDYRKELENELCDIISAIDGAGTVKVMITMDTTAEDVYAANRTESKREDASQESQMGEETEYVIIKGKDGNETAVLRKQRMPEIRGVLIVCDGGKSAVTREKITQAAAGALGIAQGKVVVTN